MDSITSELTVNGQPLDHGDLQDWHPHQQMAELQKNFPSGADYINIHESASSYNQWK
jgi:hypothetical protein